MDGAHVYRVARGPYGDSDHVAERWTLEGDEAVYQRRHAAESVVPPAELIFYTSCDECQPVLVRGSHVNFSGDLLDERRLWVEFRATFDSQEERRHIERTSGTRDDLAAELREEGLRVMRDDEPLAMAHVEIRKARETMRPRRPRARR